MTSTERGRLWRANNVERMREHRKRWRENNPDYHKGYVEQRAEQMTAHAAEYYKANADKIKARALKWKQDNRGKHNATCAKRRAAKLNATPPWLTAEHHATINAMYQVCPVGHAVDHIVPLQGEDVCGLHVPWNLRIVTEADNCSKGNKII